MNRLRRNPDFLIVGAQKAGTTTLADVLGQLPGVAAPYEEIPWLESPYYERGGAERIRYMLGGRFRGADIAGIKRPDYLPNRLVHQRIAAEFPTASLIAVLRNPSRRAFSATLHYMEYGNIPLMDPNDALRKLLDGETFGLPRAHEILDWGFYSAQFRSLERCGLGGNLSVISQADLVEAPLSTIRTVPLFANRVLPEVEVPRRNPGARGRRQLMLRRAMHAALANSDPVTGRSLRRSKNPLRLGAALVCREASRLVSEAREYSLDSSVRSRLDELYAADVEEVRTRYGCDLSRSS